MTNIVQEVRELLSRVSVPPETALPEGAREDEITGFHASTGRKLPPELDEWLRISNGPLVGPGGLFGITRDRPEARRAETIQAILDLFPAWKSLGWTPVAGDGCGNYYVLSTENRAVYFVDVAEDRTEPAYVVASDLWRFLRFLLRRELGHAYWPFDARRVLEEDPDLEHATGAPLPWIA